MATASLNQTKSSISAEFEVVQGGAAILNAKIPFNYPGYHAEIYEHGELKYSIRWDIGKNLNGVVQKGSNKELAVYNVCDACGNAIGQLSRKRSKFWGGYFYFVLELSGVEYKLYEIGLGKQGIKLPVFHNDLQIALVEKDITVYNNCDTYQILFGNDTSLLVSVLLTLYYDNLRFGNHGEVVTNSKKSFYYLSTNKELKGKYNPDWRP